nr:MAG: hypothetical protein AM324_03930 [Candidatus Thorarchaeota archaeon SMTZ1-83]
MATAAFRGFLKSIVKCKRLANTARSGQPEFNALFDDSKVLDSDLKQENTTSFRVLVFFP